ncbi:unnamed protein product [Ectocarpus sp. 12 AP-2014]
MTNEKRWHDGMDQTINLRANTVRLSLNICLLVEKKSRFILRPQRLSPLQYTPSRAFAAVGTKTPSVPRCRPALHHDNTTCRALQAGRKKIQKKKGKPTR